MREQAYRMKEAWKNIPQAEQSHQKCKCEQQKKKDQNELHEMIMKEVQKSMQTMFKHMHQQHCLDNDSNIDESHHVEVMEDITVSEAIICLTCVNHPLKRLKLNILPQLQQ